MAGVVAATLDVGGNVVVEAGVDEGVGVADSVGDAAEVSLGRQAVWA